MDCKIAVLSLIAVHACAVLALPPPRDPCVCARNFAPVCGSDGTTYSNECVLNCQNHKKGTEVTVASEGRCKEDCICTYEYKPICANDGKTYSNRCTMLCQRSQNPEVDVVYEGRCTDKVDVDPPCVCTDDLEEVCGSDENTYGNPCLLNCATAKNPMLSIAHRGKCDNKVKVAEPWLGNDKVKIAEPLVENAKVSVEEPLVGNDKVMVAEPVVPQNDQVQVVEPQSDKVQVADPLAQNNRCVCPRLLKPVCGSDGKTYNNNCLLKCAGSDIVIARSGSCDEV